MSVIIGVDPHKGSHTAVAIGRDETRLATVKVRATRRQVDQLLECVLTMGPGVVLARRSVPRLRVRIGGSGCVLLGGR